MTFSSRITDDGATDGVFLTTFGESITRWPLGVEANAESVTAIVDRDDENRPGQKTFPRSGADPR